ncbi:EAL domain-containing protein [Sphingomonas sp. ASV193]|uniref:EAL domain-containing protein n=1 Tax=Sphingomonas sp. ASV193 TaxID=3144405 RepID=UPI0032E876D6
MSWWRPFAFGLRGSDRPANIPPRRRDRALETAIRQGRISVRFQPQISPASGRVQGVEALARWGSGDAEALFARATGAGLAERLSRDIQRKAIRHAAGWRGPLAGLRLSINVLPQDLARGGYVEWLLRECRMAGLNPQRLTIEIVESALLADREAIGLRLRALRALGVRVAVDDFGTGYANLAYLTSLPLDAIKIDRALVTDLVDGRRERIVVKAMIDLARDLGLNIVAEGVETPAQLALLGGWGVDSYQGFLGAEALDEPDLAEFVAARNAALAA